MELLSLALTDFRNLARVELTPARGSTVIVGPNGQGKTNLLEAVYVLATLKPLRAARLSELVRFGCPAARVEGRFRLHGAERGIAVELRAEGTRSALVDGKRAQSLEEYFGGVSVVAFTPDDLSVVKGGPEGRRAFLDRAVFNRYPAYLQESRSYARALKSRNRLLKDRADSSYLAAYDEALAKAGARLWVRRRALLGELGARATKAFDAIGRTPEPARFGYAPSWLEADFASTSEQQLETLLHEELGRRLQRDLDRGYSTAGPHADDLSVELGGRAARSFASQGQQRALVLAWKIAEIENLASAMGFLPLLLLDDVSSELDPERNAYLMEYLAKSGAQAFLTTTDPALVRRAAGPDSLWYRVQTGAVEPIQAPPEG